MATGKLKINLKTPK